MGVSGEDGSDDSNPISAMCAHVCKEAVPSRAVTPPAVVSLLVLSEEGDQQAIYTPWLEAFLSFLATYNCY